MKLFTLQLVEQCKQVRELINFHSMAQLHFIFQSWKANKLYLTKQREPRRKKNLFTLTSKRIFQFEMKMKIPMKNVLRPTYTTHPSHHYDKYSVSFFKKYFLTSCYTEMIHFWNNWTSSIVFKYEGVMLTILTRVKLILKIAFGCQFLFFMLLFIWCFCNQIFTNFSSLWFHFLFAEMRSTNRIIKFPYRF